MSIHNPIPHHIALLPILKEDLHYIQRAARRANIPDHDMIHDIIEKHRYPGKPGPESGTKISTPAAAAGVICPKETGEMDPETSCQTCKHYPVCFSKIMGSLL